MKKNLLFIVAGVVLTCGITVNAQTRAQAGAQSNGAASTQAATNGAALSEGATFNAELNSSIDSKKAKAGDPVAAHTTEAVKSGGKVVIPKGAKLIGHVTQASAKSKGETESALGVVFDKAILKNGQEVPLNVA